MGYDLHITRATDWSDNLGCEITAEEWLAVVDADPELALSQANGPYFADWLVGAREDAPWLDWSAGNIYTKHPSSALLRKMADIATLLGARVQGDEGEFYAGNEPMDQYRAGVSRRRQPKESLWRRLLGW